MRNYSRCKVARLKRALGLGRGSFRIIFFRALPVGAFVQLLVRASSLFSLSAVPTLKVTRLRDELMSTNITTIPRIIHQTFRSHWALTRKQHRIMQTWIDKNPSWMIMQHTDSDCLRVIGEHTPTWLERFQSLRSVAEKADVCRYIVLYVYGGVYADIDVECVWPLDWWLSANVSLVVGIENDFSSITDATQRSYARRRQYQQWFIAASRRHPLFDQLLQNIIYKIYGNLKLDADEIDRSTLEKTGPAIWTDSVTKYLNDVVVEDETRLVSNSATSFSDDTWILPQVLTAAFPDAKTDSVQKHHSSVVLHHFQGSWKRRKHKSMGSRVEQRAAATETIPSKHGYPLTILLEHHFSPKADKYVLIFVPAPMQDGSTEDTSISKWGAFSEQNSIHTHLLLLNNWNFDENDVLMIEVGATTGLVSLAWAKFGIKVLCVAKSYDDLSRIDAASRLSGLKRAAKIRILAELSALKSVNEASSILAFATKLKSSHMPTQKIVLHFDNGRSLNDILNINALFLNQGKLRLFDLLLHLTGIVSYESDEAALHFVVYEALQQTNGLVLFLSENFCDTTHGTVPSCWCPIIVGDARALVEKIKRLSISQNQMIIVGQAEIAEHLTICELEV